MHCLYCDRPLAILKRLTGDGDFCSKEHRKIYQKEHNQLGLARLLESQPATKGKRPAIQQKESPAPAEPLPVAKEAERQPGQADFIPDFVPDAIAVSVADRSTAHPRFPGAAPILAESKSQAPEDRSRRALPKLATFLSESQLLFASEVRFPGTSRLEPLAGRPRLGKSQGRVAGVTIRLQPFDAGFIFGHFVAPKSSPALSSAAAPRPTGPKFSPLVPAKANDGSAHSGSHPKLSLAAFVSAPAVGARSIPGGVRSLAAEPRWKPLAAAVPTRPYGKITLVLGSFLRRPIRIATLDGVPESFEIRLLPVSFPRYSPRMGVLEGRPRRIDRIGITPP